MSELQNLEQNEEVVTGAAETEENAAAENGQSIQADKKEEDKADKFIRLAESRTSKAIKAVLALKPLANKGSYAYTEEQTDEMFAAIQEAVDEVKSAFASREKEEKTARFTFKR